jgi:hypothetical protein
MTTEQQVAFADEMAEKLLHCAREFHRLCMTYEQQACAEASKLLRQQAREYPDIQEQQEASYGASKEFGW